MSRLDGYLNRDTMEREDVASLMEDESENIKIYRFTELTTDDGFRQTNPVRDLRLFKIVKGRIDRADAVIHPKLGEVSRSVIYTFTATLYYKGLKIDDILEARGERYTVTAVSKIGKSFTEAEVEVQT